MKYATGIMTLLMGVGCLLIPEKSGPITAVIAALIYWQIICDGGNA